MAISLIHTFVSGKGDGGDATLVQPSNWNAQHTLNCATGVVLGRTTAGTGAVQELTLTTSGAALLAAADSNAAALAVGAVPIGGGIDWWDDVLPVGTNGVTWAWGNGQAISRTTYSVLFARWSTNYGVGNGTTTFNIPDVRERTRVGKSTMGSTSSQNIITQYTMTTVGGLIGESKHTLSQAELPNVNFTGTAASHSHTGGQASTKTGSEDRGGGNFQPATNIGTGNIWNGAAGSTDLSGTLAVTVASGGSGSGHNVVQPGIVCNYIFRIS